MRKFTHSQKAILGGALVSSNDRQRTGSRNRRTLGRNRHAMMSAKTRRRTETGSSLILALVYIVAVSLIVGAMADWAMNDLNNTTHFQSASSTDYALSGATEVAIQSIRYSPQYPATQSPTVASCWAPPSGNYVSEVTINSVAAAVWCSTAQNLKSPRTRVVTFIACTENSLDPTNQGAVNAALSVCESGPTLTAVVAFDDYPSGGGGLLTQTCSGGQGNCGFAATTEQWVWA